MDRRNWLWRKKSSDKSSGETESSESVSSHSERFYDDQAYPNHHTQSPEVTSKATPGDDELHGSVKTLTEKLSAALLNIKVKEDLVKQHAKVTEEAVSGWEKAESEVLALKQQLKAAGQKNSVLEDRVGNLDGALKECVRQLRQAREEQDQKISDAIAKKTCEWEVTKSEFESQLLELQSQLQATKAEALTSVNPDLSPELDAAEKENSALKRELLSRVEELEIRIIERDLSTQAAETASKQHLESIKKVAKLEAECRRLKAMNRKASTTNDYRSVTASSVYVESFTDSQSDNGERLLVVENDSRKIGGLEQSESQPGHSDSWASASIAELDQFKSDKVLGRDFMVPSVEIDLMDDFLEMERLAALPETESGSYWPNSGASLDQPDDGKSSLKAELEAASSRTSELEHELEKKEMEKMELEIALTECQDQVNTLRNQLMEVEMKLVELQTQLASAHEARIAAETELDTSNAKRELSESHLQVTETELKTLLSKVGSLEQELQKEQVLSAEAVTKSKKLEDEILRMKHEVQTQKAAILNGDLKIKQEKELAVATSKFSECQKTIASLGRQLKSLATLEDLLTDTEKTLELHKEGSQCPEGSPGTWKLHPGDLHLQEMDSQAPRNIISSANQSANGNDVDYLLSGSPVITVEKSQSGFGKLFPRIKQATG